MLIGIFIKKGGVLELSKFTEIHGYGNKYYKKYPDEDEIKTGIHTWIRRNTKLISTLGYKKVKLDKKLSDTFFNLLHNYSKKPNRIVKLKMKS